MLKNASILTSIFLLIAVCSNAQEDKRALAILDAMSKRYQAYSSYKVTFSYTAANARPSKGEALVKGEKFILRMADQEILTDGKLMATHLKESNEVTLQAYDPEEIGDLSPTRIYLAYRKGYKNTFINEAQIKGRTVQNVRLTPTSSSSPISKIELTIDKADMSIKGWKIFSKGTGETTQFEVTDFQINPTVNDAIFTFSSSTFPGAEVIDLR